MYPIASARVRAQQRIRAPRFQSQFFSRGCKSVLPTSLSYIYLLTRGCSPLRPDAVISTCRYGQNIHTDFNEQLVMHLTHGTIACLASKSTIANTNQIKPCITVEKESERFPGKMPQLELIECHRYISTSWPGNMYNASFRA